MSSTYIWLILVIDFGWTVLSNKGHIWDSVKLGGKNCKNGWSAGYVLPWSVGAIQE